MIVEVHGPREPTGDDMGQEPVIVRMSLEMEEVPNIGDQTRVLELGEWDSVGDIFRHSHYRSACASWSLVGRGKSVDDLACKPSRWHFSYIHPWRQAVSKRRGPVSRMKQDGAWNVARPGRISSDGGTDIGKAIRCHPDTAGERTAEAVGANECLFVLHKVHRLGKMREPQAVEVDQLLHAALAVGVCASSVVQPHQPGVEAHLVRGQVALQFLAPPVARLPDLGLVVVAAHALECPLKV